MSFVVNMGWIDVDGRLEGEERSGGNGKRCTFVLGKRHLERPHEKGRYLPRVDRSTEQTTTNELIDW